MTIAPPVTAHEATAQRPARSCDSASYRLAFEDAEFLHSEDLRPVRLQLELLKPERALRLEEIRSTILVLGSARVLAPDEAQARCAAAEARLREGPRDPDRFDELVRAQRQVAYAHYYQEARRFTRLVSQRFQRAGRRDFVVVTGGGPGIMEAANRGAAEVGARSVGFNITLPHEQAPNPYVTPELCFRFHYFALRKMHLLLRARALVAFPGGYGTLDELFEVLTLVQTGKIARMPIVLFGSQFWLRVVDFDFLLEQGLISAADAALFSIVDTAEDAIAQLHDFYHGQAPE
jgi:uncharacterized protein (TIGR00730 family)